ncbi:GNAT family N-acetyltransferase [uncultured Clostridium sp.]|uniref:GNAT family N-acetyltransferase n=1 Tax=uncultured Clostridium sp. TaxID=59620 RepID=UPI0025873436|nr:GNAT family N-acetyltransferase [uncultured Clostridium sp.]
MSKVIYRDLLKEDYNSIKSLICEAFGFKTFTNDENLLDSVLNIYLQNCIISSSYCKIAEINNEVVGIILGKAKEDKNKLWSIKNLISILKSFIKLISINSKNKKIIKELSNITSIYKDLIRNKENQFQGCIQLFIISEKYRELKIGKTLLSYLFSYMKSYKVNSLYLFTDTRCNYGFYDSQGFERIGEKKLLINSNKEILNVFLYKYIF